MRNPFRGLIVSDRWFNRLVVGGVALGFFVLLGTGIAAFQAVRENEVHTRWVSHTFEVERELGNFNALIERAETGRRGYLLSGAPNTARTYYQASGALLPSLARIARLTSDNPRQQANVARLAHLTREDLATMNQSVMLVKTGAPGRRSRYLP